MATPKAEEMMAMLRVIEAAKEAVKQFEDGDINLREAIRLLRDATTGVRAAA